MAASEPGPRSPPVMPHPRAQSAAAIVDNKVYIMGGEQMAALFRRLTFMIRPSMCGRPMLPCQRPASFLGAAEVDDTIYAVGGEALVARVGEQFTYQITATNNPTSYDASPLPDGLSIDRDRGIIYGIPTTPAQAFVVTLTATNGSGSDFKDVSFYIANPLPPVPELESIVSSTCVTGRAGQPFTFQVLTNNASSETRSLRPLACPMKRAGDPE